MSAPSSASVEAARLITEMTSPAAGDAASRLVFYASQITAAEILKLAGEAQS